MSTDKTSLENENQPSCLGAVSRRLINTYIVVLDSDHWAFDSEVVKLHELENGKWYKEDKSGRLTSFDSEVAKRLANVC